jgi:Flp pilus assembly pilin Flp
MIQEMTRSLRGFRREEDGTSTVEFALLFPMLLVILFSTVELGLIHIQQSMLERGLDLTVRDIRLGTGSAPQHDEIRDLICARAAFINDCDTSLRLEMVQSSPYLPLTIDSQPDCVERIEEVQPVRSFVNGDSNELMFLRACLKFEPIFPHLGLATSMSADEDGRISLYASTAFVQEPR